MTAGLLSRIAETLFWAGRYVERADDTARMVDVYAHRILAEPHADEDTGCRALLAVLGTPAVGDAPLDVTLTLARIAYDGTNPSAIAGAIRAAHAAARSAREIISSEMWECLNITSHALAGQCRAAERLGPNVFLRFVRERAALFFGLADSTMSHDEAWRFLLLGRSVERVDMTARLLLAQMPGDPHDPGWPMLLRACGAYESFLRTCGWVDGPEPVAEFLLLDRAFPRSVVYTLGVAENCLATLEPIMSGRAVGGGARRPIGRLRTRLEYSEPRLAPAELAVLLGDLQQACQEATDAIADRFFICEEPVAWEHEW